MTEPTIPAVLRERASLQPNDAAFTFIDYDKDWNGHAETLTWGQLYRRTVNLAAELSECAAIGDRAVIVAPQGLEYLVGFLGSLQAGLIAVPLSTPIVGGHDERVRAVIDDCAPAVLLTTSAIAEVVAEYAIAVDGRPAPKVIAIDQFDLDGRRRPAPRRVDRPETAYLQYTSGSTRTPAGVMVSYENLSANFRQMVAAYFQEFAGVAPADTTAVSWLPFYHDMGLLLGVCAPILGGWHSVFTTPLSFLARPARWMQLLASYPRALTAGPNFAFELTIGKTTDEDMEGHDLGDVVAVISGSERVHDATLKRFISRFGKFNLRDTVIRPSYGLAEATLYVATADAGRPPKVVSFDTEKLSAGRAEPLVGEGGTPLVSYGVPSNPAVRIVDAETCAEAPAGTVGEIWVQGPNVCLGYWQRPEQSERVFGARIVDPAPGTPEGTWLRTGDLGFVSEGELFIVGRMKDLLIVRGRNHYPDDIEATIQEITKGRVAAIPVEVDRTEQLVAIIEVRQRPEDAAEARERFAALKAELTSAITNAHGISPADLVLVGRGAIPITTSGKVRRASCVEMYNRGEFARLDA